MDEMTKLTHAWLQNKPLEHVQDYVGRGRLHAGLQTDELKAQWVNAFKRMIADLRTPELRQAAQDLEAELVLRKEDAPYDLVRAELAAFSAAAMAAIEMLRKDPERFAKADQELAQKIVAFYSATKDSAQN